MGEVQPLPSHGFSPRPQLLATDMDGTLTRQGKFTPALLQGLEQLQGLGLPVMIVTGRSAGWVNGLAHYLPVVGAMAENGGIYFPHNGPPEPLVDIPNLVAHRQLLQQAFAQLQWRWPQLRESDDNRFRLTDWTFDIEGLTQADLDEMAQLCQSLAWGFTYSTVQCHLFTLGQSKAAGLQRVVERYFAPIAATEVLTVGDSPNDESMFNPALFPQSVGVANVTDYWPRLTYHPTYVTQAAEVAGFLELIEALVQFF
ncbi:HAD family hydrolase [Phormidium tenue]|uniref:HAD family hydrolase n=1 Tax=Phormidium tenue NIES-30 TaxID=549789 RepID=A0A1U7J933_9CYAN|nr:HAD family hydrolase [Phormidium tenue]MBD2231038.1 HAD family phosphatase [Phormidium tenue FACHB-1052]OKH49929.1 HAD family hydrolase [Phormidium tenue NIES-30]